MPSLVRRLGTSQTPRRVAIRPSEYWEAPLPCSPTSGDRPAESPERSAPTVERARLQPVDSPLVERPAGEAPEPSEREQAKRELAERVAASRVEDEELTGSAPARDRPSPLPPIGRISFAQARFRRPVGFLGTIGRVLPASRGRTSAATPPGACGPAIARPPARGSEQESERRPDRTRRWPDRTRATRDAGPVPSERVRIRAICLTLHRSRLRHRRGLRSPRGTWGSGSSCPPSSRAPSASFRTRCTARSLA